MTAVSHPKYRADIDGLRALAVVPVVLFHAFPSMLPGGFVGVDIFFVISGFLISSIIIKSTSEGTFTYKDFYIRRINRIFPTLSLVLATALIFGWFSLYADEYMQLGKHTAAGAGFVANITLLLESGYFDTASNTKILLHLWSLGVEEQFYILWPPLLLLFRRVRNLIPLVISVVILISFSANIFYMRIDASIAFYSPLTRFWELAIGSLLAYVFIKKKESIPFGALTKNIVSVVGVSLIIYSIIFIREKDFPGYNAIYPVLGAALLIASGPTSFVNRYVISNKAFVFIGLISYPLYLWHWPIFTYLRIITSGDVADRYMWVAVSAAFVISIVTYYLWEKPLRFSTNKPRTACLLALLVFLIGATGLAIYLSDGVKSRSVVSDASAVNAQFTGSLWKYTSNDICLNRYPMNGRNEYKWFFCMQNNDSQPDIMLYGSSFANQQYPGMIDNPAFDGKTILSIGTCAPDMPDSSARHDNHPCAADRPGQVKDLVKDIIIKSPGLKYVIIDGVDYEHKEGNLERLSDFIKWVEGQGRTVVVFYPHVRPFFDTKACFSRPFSPKAKECVATNTERNRMEKNFIEMRNSISKTLPGTLFFNQNDALCDGDYCPFVRDGLPMYRDKVHLSVYGSDLVIRKFVGWARDNKLSIVK